ncbi:molybdopterin-dependent oxidoreductase [Chitinophaga nivalis]|uniref:Molybdopterin-dependent oxidoreductase n=1 Tax=Chitinophaga nivalis TaxID=2991709 RepID=A0ABT3ILF5_9BACT|nr:molybdopterin-dependent oxidoreductase [Chitinophaga nivalis]MCW3465502.1 molybdopterin-dependent oxidoreductase [Chitinophaga nivalis]MCW3484807.1 molybdopterin-dependent oxidoreductase [Chitinophaga nivalis]
MKTYVFILCIFFVHAARAGTRTLQTDTAGYYSSTVHIKGRVAHPLTIDSSNIHRFPSREGRRLQITGSDGTVRKTYHHYRGIALKTLLDSAGILMDPPKEKGKYYIVVKAIDGYTALFTWNEIFNNPTGDRVWLLYEANGQPIRQDGRFVLVCPVDKITGARHVKWVQTIEVSRLSS